MMKLICLKNNQAENIEVKTENSSDRLYKLPAIIDLYPHVKAPTLSGLNLKTKTHYCATWSSGHYHSTQYLNPIAISSVFDDNQIMRENSYCENHLYYIGPTLPQNHEHLLKACLYLSSFNPTIIASCKDFNLYETNSLHQHQICFEKGFKENYHCSETVAVQMLIEIARITNCHIHLSNISSRFSLQLIEQAKNDHLPITVDTSIYHLQFCIDHLIDQEHENLFYLGTPIREKQDQEALKSAIMTGLIDAITDDPHQHLKKTKRNLLEEVISFIQAEKLNPIPYLQAISVNPQKIIKNEQHDESIILNLSQCMIL